MGLTDYGIAAAAFFVAFLLVYGIVFIALYKCDQRKNCNPQTSEEAKPVEEDMTDDDAKDTRQKIKAQEQEDYESALEQIGNESVYSFFVTEKDPCWKKVVAVITLLTQIALLVLFIVASEAKLQDEKTEIKFSWKCPRDSDTCKNTSDLDTFGWACFSLLMFANLAKDLIGGFKLTHHSSRARHSQGRRIRYLLGGMSLTSITLFALYVSCYLECCSSSLFITSYLIGYPFVSLSLG